MEVCECDALVASYERLTALYHDLLGQESLAALLARAAEAVAELVPCSSLLIAEADVEQQVIVPLVVRGAWQEETLQMRPRFGEGLIGWAAANGRPVLANEAHLDARAGQVVGTPDGEPEAVMCFPLISSGVVVGAFSLYREGEGAILQRRGVRGGAALRGRDDTCCRECEGARTAFVPRAKRLPHRLPEQAWVPRGGCSRSQRLHPPNRSRSCSSTSMTSRTSTTSTGMERATSCCARSRISSVRPRQKELSSRGWAVTSSRFSSRRRSTVSTADVAESVRTTLDPLTFVSAGKAISVTASVGFAEEAVSNQSIEERLLRIADESMYRDKNGEPVGHCRPSSASRPAHP